MNKIAECKSSMVVANCLIDLTQENIQKTVAERNPKKSKQLTQSGLDKLKMGNGQKRKYEEEMKRLEISKTKALIKSPNKLHFFLWHVHMYHTWIFRYSTYAFRHWNHLFILHEESCDFFHKLNCFLIFARFIL